MNISPNASRSKLHRFFQMFQVCSHSGIDTINLQLIFLLLYASSWMIRHHRGGIVFGWSMTVVTPPCCSCAWALCTVFFLCQSGSRKWTWMSIATWNNESSFSVNYSINFFDQNYFSDFWYLTVPYCYFCRLDCIIDENSCIFIMRSLDISTNIIALWQ